MKKLILGALAFLLLFTSCETEPLAQESLTGIEGKTSINTDGDNCETAFGRFCYCEDRNTCFSDFGISRWGWSVLLDESPVSYRFALYAGAGQCSWDEKGEDVGYVMVTFNNGLVTFGDVMLDPDFELQEFHFYSGDTEMPLKKNGDMTAAPGKYTNNGDVDDDGKVYVIVHAVVCEVVD